MTRGGAAVVKIGRPVPDSRVNAARDAIRPGLSPRKPLPSEQADAPYNYTFADFIDQQQSDHIKQIVGGDVSVTPSFENTETAIRRLGPDHHRYLGHLGLVEEHPAIRAADDAVQRVLPRDGAVDLRELHRRVRDGPPGMV